MNILKIYTSAISSFGIDSQLVVLIEEMSELTKEITKIIRGKGVYINIIEEIADVKIMLDQLSLIMEINGNENYKNDINAMKNKKIQRLKDLLDEKNNQLKIF